MEHEIDLSKFNIRCDLISETIENNYYKSIKVQKKNYGDIRVERVIVKDDDEKILNKKRGIYSTIYFKDVTDVSNRKNLTSVLVKEINGILNKKKLNDKPVLIVGLGNRLSTPDSLGPKVVDSIVVTRHLFNIEGISPSANVGNVSAFSPGVYAATGIESSDILKGIISVASFSYVIVIDALASSTIEKVNKVVQISDAGVEPGSGVGNSRKEISYESLGIPVIAIGVPTVVDAATIVNDTMKFLMKKISYDIKNIDNESEKFIINGNHFLNTNYNLDSEERKKYFGLLGELSSDEVKKLFSEVLTPIGYNFMVTPKEIDFEVDKLSITISQALNQVLHSK